MPRGGPMSMKCPWQRDETFGGYEYFPHSVRSLLSLNFIADLLARHHYKST